MEINYLAILVCGLASMVLGTLWYGFLFQKQWMKIIGATEMDKKARVEMQKKAMPLYAGQFVIALLQAGVFAYIYGLLKWWGSGIELAAVLFVGIVIPVLFATSMWNNDSSKVAWSRFGIQSGYFLALLVVYGAIIGSW